MAYHITIPMNLESSALPPDKAIGRVGTMILGQMLRAQSFTADQWRQLFAEYHVIFDVPYVSCHNLETDELHVMHLGTSQYVLGAVLLILCFKLMAGTPEANSHNIWTAINMFYIDYKVETQYSSLKISAFYEPGQFPRLKGKGAEIKDLAAPLAKVWSGRMTMDNPEHQQVQAMLQYQCTAQRIMHDHKDMVFRPTHAAI